MISNQIFGELEALGLVSGKHLVKISDTTRDKDIPVYKDMKSGVILLERVETDTAYYETKMPDDEIRKIVSTALKGGKIVVSSRLEDEN